MKTLTAEAVSALQSNRLALAVLVKMDFPGQPVLLGTANYDIGAPSGLYLGARGLGDIGQIDDSPGEIKGLNFALSGVPIELLTTALDEAGVVQLTPVSIRMAIINADTRALCDEDLLWAGRFDTMNIEETGETCSIAATAESSAVDLLRGNPQTYTDADQQAIYPGDRAFEYVVSQSSAQIVWPDRLYFVAKGGG